MRTTYSNRSIGQLNRTRNYQHSGVSQTLLAETVCHNSTEPVIEIAKGAEWLVASKTNRYHINEAGFPRYYVVIYDGEWRYSCADEGVRKYCRSAVEAFWQAQAA